MARKRMKQQGEPDTGFQAGFQGEAGAARDSQKLAPVDIQQKVFRLAFRGYNERDVDEFLDRVTADLAALHEENKRLTEQLAEGGGTGAGMEEARRQAESIVREAREHAARLVDDAERQARTIGAGPQVGGVLLPSFLLREREFLQQMAALIQDHARRLKEEARRSRVAAEQAEQAEPAGEPAAPAEEPFGSPPEEARYGTEEAAVGGPAAGALAATEPPVVEEQVEATAPWTPIGAEPVEEALAEGGRGDEDPLMSAWESAFTGEPEATGPSRETTPEPPGPEPGTDEEKEEEEDKAEPSLRELFWGEE